MSIEGQMSHHFRAILVLDDETLVREQMKNIHFLKIMKCVLSFQNLEAIIILKDNNSLKFTFTAHLIDILLTYVIGMVYVPLLVCEKKQNPHRNTIAIVKKKLVNLTFIACMYGLGLFNHKCFPTITNILSHCRDNMQVNVEVKLTSQNIIEYMTCLLHSESSECFIHTCYLTIQDNFTVESTYKPVAINRYILKVRHTKLNFLCVYIFICNIYYIHMYRQLIVLLTRLKIQLPPHHQQQQLLLLPPPPLVMFLLSHQ
jgi:hypothetical protein